MAQKSSRRESRRFRPAIGLALAAWLWFRPRGPRIRRDRQPTCLLVGSGITGKKTLFEGDQCPMAKPSVQYLCFDVESVADGALVSSVRYPGKQLSGAAAIGRYRSKLMEKYERPFKSCDLSRAGSLYR